VHRDRVVRCYHLHTLYRTIVGVVGSGNRLSKAWQSTHQAKEDICGVGLITLQAKEVGASPTPATYHAYNLTK